MRRMFKSACLCILVFGLYSTALGGPNAGFKVAVHVQMHTAKQSCLDLPAIVNCHDIQTTCSSAGVDFFPVFYDLTDYIAISYGVIWPDAWGSCVFNICSWSSFGDIETSGDGISQAWHDCQSGPVAVLGWGWLDASSPGVICLVDHPEPLLDLAVSSCSNEKDIGTCSFCGGVYGALGDDPCGPSAIESSAWGDIKSMFR
jgi:hypothetical protein